MFDIVHDHKNPVYIENLGKKLVMLERHSISGTQVHWYAQIAWWLRVVRFIVLSLVYLLRTLQPYCTHF
jgi:hypothetical protein